MAFISKFFAASSKFTLSQIWLCKHWQTLCIIYSIYLLFTYSIIVSS